jgi:hypothetical protein
LKRGRRGDDTGRKTLKDIGGSFLKRTADKVRLTKRSAHRALHGRPDVIGPEAEMRHVTFRLVRAATLFMASGGFPFPSDPAPPKARSTGSPS